MAPKDRINQGRAKISDNKTNKPPEVRFPVGESTMEANGLVSEKLLRDEYRSGRTLILGSLGSLFFLTWVYSYFYLWNDGDPTNLAVIIAGVSFLGFSTILPLSLSRHVFCMFARLVNASAYDLIEGCENSLAEQESDLKGA